MDREAGSSARRRAMPVCAAITAVASGLLAWPSAQGRAATPRGQLVQQGRDFALEACGACHQVAPHDPMPAAVDTGQGTKVKAPSFTAIMRDPRKDAIYLRSVIRLPHYPMKEQDIAPGDLDAVVAYLQSLRPRR